MESNGSSCYAYMYTMRYTYMYTMNVETEQKHAIHLCVPRRTRPFLFSILVLFDSKDGLLPLANI